MEMHRTPQLQRWNCLFVMLWYREARTAAEPAPIRLYMRLKLPNVLMDIMYCFIIVPAFLCVLAQHSSKVPPLRRVICDQTKALRCRVLNNITSTRCSNHFKRWWLDNSDRHLWREMDCKVKRHILESMILSWMSSILSTTCDWVTVFHWRGLYLLIHYLLLAWDFKYLFFL